MGKLPFAAVPVHAGVHVQSIVKQSIVMQSCSHAVLQSEFNNSPPSSP